MTARTFPPAPAKAARRLAATLCLSLGAGLLAGAGLVSGLEAGGLLVSQKGRAFQPGSLAVKRGETITIVNDDSDLLHHLYVESETFTFDSGDQMPGSRTAITFSQGGTFQVLCGIHPKMKLAVRVTP
ncbi:plastocyanin [Methylobacterium nigriterrae]|uniref:plastocyanin n=1 Tax=Methylobacterium nigriterrae TaxID=3127512 RepID=UPI00301408AE